MRRVPAEGYDSIAGATIWTDFDLFGDPHRAMMVAVERMNDFRKVRIGRYVERFRPSHALARHRQARAFLELEMRKPRVGKLVVITHHAPHPGAALAPSDPPRPDDILNAAYRSDGLDAAGGGWRARRLEARRSLGLRPYPRVR